MGHFGPFWRQNGGKWGGVRTLITFGLKKVIKVLLEIWPLWLRLLFRPFYKGFL